MANRQNGYSITYFFVYEVMAILLGEAQIQAVSFGPPLGYESVGMVAIRGALTLHY